MVMTMLNLLLVASASEAVAICLAVANVSAFLSASCACPDTAVNAIAITTPASFPLMRFNVASKCEGSNSRKHTLIGISHQAFNFEPPCGAVHRAQLVPRRRRDGRAHS